MTNVCERWAIDHTNALQGAWFNGVGFETWENVWGTWNGITPRDGEQIRRLHVLLGFLGGRGYLQSQEWLPHSGTDQPDAVFASYWPLKSSAAWTVRKTPLKEPDLQCVNRSICQDKLRTNTGTGKNDVLFSAGRLPRSESDRQRQSQACERTVASCWRELALLRSLGG